MLRTIGYYVRSVLLVIIAFLLAFYASTLVHAAMHSMEVGIYSNMPY